MKGIVSKVEVILAKKKDWISYWRLLGHNGETLAHSEIYTTKRKCLQTAKKVAKQLGLEIKD